MNLVATHWLDIVLVVTLVFVAVGGARRGLAIELLRYVGLLAGLVLGAWLATRIGLLVSTQDSVQRVLIGVSVFVIVAMVGQAIGVRLGASIKERTDGRWVGQFDVAGGAVVAVVVATISMWLLGNALSSGPSPVLSRAISDSAVLSTIDRYAPRPPAAFAEVRRLFDRTVFPDVFADLRPPAADGPPPPVGATAGISQAAASTVRIESEGCGGLVFGSGFPVSENLFVTNAHVVAGTQDQIIRTRDGVRRDATVIQFDPERDLAIMRVENAGLQPLDALQDVPDGTTGAVIGYPGGGDQQIVGARVVSQTSAVGRDIYSRSLARRDIYILRSQIEKGDSGGPVVNNDGRLIGVVFAASTLDDNEGYALTTRELQNVLAEVPSTGAAVSVGACAT